MNEVKIKKVEIVPGYALKENWKSNMQKVWIEGEDDFYIDTLPQNGGSNWKEFKGKYVANVFFKDSVGFKWIQSDFKGLIVNETSFLEKGDSIPQIDINSNSYFKNFREKYKAEYRTMDGHFVRSRAEVIIDNALFNYKVVHIYERKLPILEDVYSDFFIPEINGSKPVYIEFWGLENEEGYTERKSIKKSIVGEDLFSS